MRGGAFARPLAGVPVRFFVLVFVLGAPFWLLDLVSGTRLPANLPLGALQFVCPLIAVLVCARIDGTVRVRSLLRRAVDPVAINRRRWYVPVLALMPAIHLLAYGLMRWIGQPVPDPRLAVTTVLLSFAVYFVGALCEEVGWTAYATDPLQHRWGELPASLFIGVVWAAWHVVPWLHLHDPGWVLWQFVFTVAARVLIVRIYNGSGRSVFAVILFHTTINVSYTMFPVGGSHYDPSFLAPLAVVAAILLSLSRVRWPHRVRG